MQKNYVATTVTLALANTAYNLMSLITDATNGNEPNCPQACRELTLQADPQDASGANFAVGDATLAAAKIGFRLLHGEAKTYRSEGRDTVYPGTKYVMADQANALLNVEIEKG